jgi:hypothetical protein
MDHLDNYYLAVMAALNELAERHGIAPYEFCAHVRNAPILSPSPITVTFDTPPSGTDSYSRMLSSLGLSLTQEEPVQLVGTERHVWDTIQAALARAPRRLIRG